MVKEMPLRVKKIIGKCIKWLFGVLLHLFWMFPIKNNRIVFSSFGGTYYNDSPKAISDVFREKEYEIIWLLKHGNNGFTNDQINFISPYSIKGIFYIATAKVWVSNSRLESWICKRKSQIYLQTWHGSVGLKTVEQDAESTLNPDYIREAKHDGKMTDIMISNCRWCSELYRRAFWTNAEIIETGLPRLDELFNGKVINNEQYIRKRIGLKVDDNIVLYAPTFRKNYSFDAYNIDFCKLSNALEKKTGLKWKVLLRLHPNLYKLANSFSNDWTINVSSYPDIYQLIGISDLVISDYSSLMFEAGFILKPVFMYASDLDKYSEERQLYFDIKQLPFSLATNSDALIENIINFDSDVYQDKLRNFNSMLGIVDKGDAAKTTAELIIHRIGDRK